MEQMTYFKECLPYFSFAIIGIITLCFKVFAFKGQFAFVRQCLMSVLVILITVLIFSLIVLWPLIQVYSKSVDFYICKKYHASENTCVKENLVLQESISQAKQAGASQDLITSFVKTAVDKVNHSSSE
jgi:hypothetical protein